MAQGNSGLLIAIAAGVGLWLYGRSRETGSQQQTGPQQGGAAGYKPPATSSVKPPKDGSGGNGSTLNIGPTMEDQPGDQLGGGGNYFVPPNQFPSEEELLRQSKVGDQYHGGGFSGGTWWNETEVM